MGKEKPPSNKKEGLSEKGLRFYRNINILGAVALGGVAVLAPPLIAVPAAALAGIDVLQAGGSELALRTVKKRKAKKKPKQ
ncbi:MAG TPA: hypothetical protein VMY99_05470 [Nevskiaceae bacterium]|nr:hypothetical protein [Nevskiaceae bacterium]